MVLKGFSKNVSIAMLILSVLVFQSIANSQEAGIPKDKKQKTGYALGYSIGRDMKNFGVDIDPEMVLQGVKDALSGKSKIDEQEVRTIMNDLNKELQAKQAEKFKTVADKNKQEGDAFLLENAKQPGVVKLPSGLQYKVMKDGSGKMPKATDTVAVHYRGRFINGTEFDSSYKRNQPAEFKVNGVIPGWTEVLQKMKEGSKYMVYIPSNLAYGERVGGPIPPNSTLVFEIELISVK